MHGRAGDPWACVGARLRATVSLGVCGDARSFALAGGTRRCGSVAADPAGEITLGDRHQPSVGPHRAALAKGIPRSYAAQRRGSSGCRKVCHRQSGPSGIGAIGSGLSALGCAMDIGADGRPQAGSYRSPLHDGARGRSPLAGDRQRSSGTVARKRAPTGLRLDRQEIGGETVLRIWLATRMRSSRLG